MRGSRRPALHDLRPRPAGGGRPVLGLAILGCAAFACAGGPAAVTTDGAAEAADRSPLGDIRTFEAEASVTCVATTATSIPSPPPELLIVLDRSGSMNDVLAGSADSKWTQIVAALEAFTLQADAMAAFGLTFVGGGNGQSSCQVLVAPTLVPVLHAAAALGDAIAQAQPAGSTPLANAVTVAAAYLAARKNGAPKFLLLATDGQPTCGTSPCGPDSTEAPNTCDEAAAIAAIAAARDQGIATFVLGVASPGSTADQTLGAMAAAGGYPRPQTPTYFSTAESGLGDVLVPLDAAASPCDFGISPAVEVGSISGVTADGVGLPFSDFQLIARDRVRLLGAACAAYVAGTLTNVRVLVPCDG